MHNDKLTQTGQLTMVALLRAQRRYDEALDLAQALVRSDPLGVRPRLAASLCLMDTGQWHDAKSILDELIKSDSKDPEFKHSPSFSVRHKRSGSTSKFHSSSTMQKTPRSGWTLHPSMHTLLFSRKVAWTRR